MKNIVIVNGENTWPEYFPGFAIHQRRVQTSLWLYQNEALWVFDHTGGVRVDAVLWRVGAIRPHDRQRHILELIRMARVPCLNPASVLLRGYDRLSMLNELREADLPVLPLMIALGDDLLGLVEPHLPAVAKVGNFHGGYGKLRVLDDEQWQEAKGMAFVADTYTTIEPFIDYVRDIRCLAVGEQIWAMARRGASWKANTQTVHYELIPVPPLLQTYTIRAMQHLGADVLGLDFLEKQDGSYVLLESNDIPGLTGFPDIVRQVIAERLRIQLR